MARKGPSEGELVEEARLHDLIIGDLVGADKQAVLSAIACDAGLRDRVSDMIRIQTLVRKAFGYDVADEVVKKSLARLLATLAEG